MPKQKHPETVWTTFKLCCGKCDEIFPAADGIASFISGGCETCEYSTWYIRCPRCKAQEGSDW